MNDWKDKLKNSELYKTGGGGMNKRCADCNNEFVPREPHHKICFDCLKKKREGVAVHDRVHAKLPLDYLSKSYFDEKGYMRAGIFKEEAKVVAGVLATIGMTPTSLRVFYNKLKAIENQYKLSINLASK